MKKILVIDDAEFILESTSTLLKFEGYEVVTAADGKEGVEVALKEYPDLILCDISMPFLDGYGVLDEIRSEQKTATTPFIFLTAFTEKSNMRQGMEKGADDFLVKPFTRDELIAAIDAQWVKHARIEKEMKEKVEEVEKSVSYALPHEFRTALNQIVNSAKYLHSNPDKVEKEDIVELSDDIISSSQRLLKITENFLIYVRIESFATNQEKLDQIKSLVTDEPSALIYDISQIIASKYDRTQDLKFGELVDSISIHMSSESYHKLIHELVENSFKFSEKDTEVLLDTWIENETMFLKLTDKGRGMTQEQIKNVGAYRQFERSIYEQQGIGLGLVIAKRLVEIHDGEFTIISSENDGTEITFSLPLVKNAEN